MIKKIDIQSEEYLSTLEQTKKFTDSVLEKHGFVYNSNNEINEAIQMGLTRNKLIYGKTYCPCFMVIGKSQEEQEQANNRLCPCTPALEEEIPSKGSCHCGIFCTKDFEATSEENTKEVVSFNGLSIKDCEELLLKQEINSQELEALLKARESGFIEFNLVDTREWMEWISQRIVGTDFLIPTTSFYQALKRIEDQKETPVIVYCLSGSRSAYCQRIMLDLGFKTVSNLDYGISSFYGECESGEA